jgi:CPA2 family monovalent cation:H+ antiporter-2
MFPLKQIEIPELKNHLVLIGKDSRSRNISAMAGYIHLPYIAIAFDPAEVKKRQEQGETIIYGDAVNTPILKRAYIETAEVVVVSIGDMITAMSIIERVRFLNKHAAILVRTRYVEDVEDLYRVGATQVIPEEFETAIEVFERVLNKYLIPQSDISQIIGRIRKDNYGVVRQSVKSSRFSIMKELPNIEISALKINENSPVVGKNLAELDFRKNAGVTVVAIKRSDLIVENPMADTKFKKGDIVYVLGKQDQIAHTVKMFMAK